MKYFTPELLARYRSPDDAVAEAAAAEWEANTAAYRERLQAIRSRLPRSVRGLLGRYTLHDAKVLTLALGMTQPTCTLQVRLEGTPSQAGPVAEIKYRIVPGDRGGVTFTRHAPFSSAASSLGWIIYNEFDAPEKGETFVHSLLLSTGLEIVVRFQAMRVQVLDEVVVEPLELPAGKMTWPMVEAYGGSGPIRVPLSGPNSLCYRCSSTQCCNFTWSGEVGVPRPGTDCNTPISRTVSPT